MTRATAKESRKVTEIERYMLKSLYSLPRLMLWSFADTPVPKGAPTFTALKEVRAAERLRRSWLDADGFEGFDVEPRP